MFFHTTKTRRPPGCGKSRSVESEENQKQVSLASHRPWKSRTTRGIPTFPTAPTAAGISETISGFLIVVDRKEYLTPDRLLPKVRKAFGIDTSMGSLRMALEYLRRNPSVSLACMDSIQLGLRDRTFDLTICIQNGICAFAVDQQQLFREAIRVTQSGGLVMFSSYTPQVWESRLEWFAIQSAHHLIGEIDYHATGNGMIVCKDGFRATTANRATFEKLAADLGVTPRIAEVDGSSLFCEFVCP